MKNKEGLLNVASLLTTYRDDFYISIFDICEKISDNKIENIEGVAAKLELKEGISQLLFGLASKLNIKTNVIESDIEVVNQSIEFMMRKDSPIHEIIQTAIESLYVNKSIGNVAVLITNNVLRLAVYEGFCENDKVLTHEEMKVIQLFNGLNKTSKLSIIRIAKVIGHSKERASHIRIFASIKIWRAAKAIHIVPA